MQKYRHTPLRKMILQRVKINENGCWIWQGSFSNSGCGKLNNKGKHISAHRASYVSFNGKIPKNLVVCHHCDIKECVNPDHLWLGTQKENILDAKAKNRLPNLKGRKVSLKTRQKQSEIRKKKPNRYWLGKKRSKETIEKIKKTIQERRKSLITNVI